MSSFPGENNFSPGSATPQHASTMNKVIKQMAIAFIGTGMIAEAAAVDLRGYQHGVDFVPWGENYRLFWSSAPGDPPIGEQHVPLKQGIKCDYFVHDIYTSEITFPDPKINSETVIALPEAQEPVSAVRNLEGITLLTFEDGSESDISDWCDGRVEQRYQLFDAQMQPLTEINTVSVAGGHSGHAAVSGNNFAIAYSEGWIDGGGVDDAGTGDDIHLDIVDSHGVLRQHRDIAVDHGVVRDGWPLIAGAPESVIVVWQRNGGESSYANLLYSVYLTSQDVFSVDAVQIQADVDYYGFDVQYIPGVQRFLVVGNYLADARIPFAEHEIAVRSPKLFAVLLNLQGEIVARLSNDATCSQCDAYLFYVIVPESQPAININSEQTEVIYPVKPRGWISLFIAADQVRLGSFVKNSHFWFPLGTDGVFTDKHGLFFVNLTPRGVKTISGSDNVEQ